MLSTKTQVSFTTDLVLKEKALEKARKEGITLKTLFVMAMKSYIDNDLNINLSVKKDYHDNIFTDEEVVNKANELGQLLQKKNL